jgi:hypothetical protein
MVSSAFFLAFQLTQNRSHTAGHDLRFFDRDGGLRWGRHNSTNDQLSDFNRHYRLSVRKRV